MKQCGVDGCSRPHEAKGYCKLHYKRLLRNGDTELHLKKSERQAFLDEACDYDHSGCLIWPYRRNNKGRGYIHLERKYRSVNRLICERAHGKPPTDKHEAAHSCGNGHLGCCSPKHLRWATGTENKADMVAHGTRLSGEKNAQAKLTTEKVVEIRSLRGKVRGYELARRFSVSESTISMIQNGHVWPNISPAS